MYFLLTVCTMMLFVLRYFEVTTRYMIHFIPTVVLKWTCEFIKNSK